MGILQSKFKTLILISLPALFAALAGIYVSERVFQDEKDLQELTQRRESGVQIRALMEYVVSVLESSKAQGSQSYQAQKAPTGAVLNWTEFEVKDGAVVGVKRSSWNADASKIDSKIKGSRADFETAYLKQIQEKLILKNVDSSLLSIRPDSERSAQWIAQAQVVSGGVVLFLMDSQEVFAGMTRIGNYWKGLGYRAYMIDINGRVLAHTDPQYVFGSFPESAIFTDGILPVLQSSRIAGSGRYESIDQFPVVASYARVGGFPVALVTEKLSMRSSIFHRYFREGRLNRISVLALGLSLLLIALLGWVTAVLRRSGAVPEAYIDAQPAPLLPPLQTLPVFREVPTNPGLQAPRVPEVHLSDRSERLPPPPPIQVALEKKQEIKNSLEGLQSLQRERKLLLQFEEEAVRFRDPKSLASRLTAISAELCQSPTLFFKFNETLNSAVLEADAGFAPGDAPMAMNFVIEPEALAAVIHVTQQGQLASFSNYAPLSKMLMKRLGVAYFEAWAMTGFGSLGRQTGRPRLLGVLVILQAGVDSAAHFASLSHMLRTSGLVYENTLLSAL